MVDVVFVESWVISHRDEHVIHIYHEPSCSNFVFKDGVHHGLECSGRVGKTKEHDCGLK